MSAVQNSYSQSGEDLIICRELGERAGGTFLDIGAFHPFQFSNTRRLYELGYKGVFVEPSPSLREAFEKEYGADKEVVLLPVCVGTENGTQVFWDSGGDAISTLVKGETQKWVDAYGSKFTPIQVEVVSVTELLRRCPYKTFDFINIDTEGNVWDIVSQFDFQSLACKVVCLEWNGKEEKNFLQHLTKQGYSEVHRNAENMIFRAS